jgi:hypothetical protein
LGPSGWPAKEWYTSVAKYQIRALIAWHLCIPHILAVLKPDTTSTLQAHNNTWTIEHIVLCPSLQCQVGKIWTAALDHCSLD